MHRHARTNYHQRGFAMMLTLFITSLLLVIGLAMLGVSQYSAVAAQNVERKQDSFNAAEAGLNTAIDKLDGSLSYNATNTSGTLSNNYTYQYTVVNNLSGGGGVPATDPVTGQPITVPAARAFLYSKGQGPNGERATTVEAIVKQTGSQFQFPNDAIDAGLDIAGNWNYKSGIKSSSPGADDANIHANHNVTVDLGYLQGTSTASGATNSLNNSPTAVNTPQKTLPTAQMPTFVAAEKSIAKAGGPYALYIPAGGTVPSTYTCPDGAPATGCVVFLDGPLTISGHQEITFTGTVTFVVNGNYSATGQSQISFQAGTKSLFAVNGNADDGGLGTMYALIWSKGDTILHGNGWQTGAVVAGGNAYLYGGGSNGGFIYDQALSNFSINLPGHIVVSAYGEY
jgi:Tfp pilus assembly protein PilX